MLITIVLPRKIWQIAEHRERVAERLDKEFGVTEIDTILIELCGVVSCEATTRQVAELSVSDYFDQISTVKLKHFLAATMDRAEIGKLRFADLSLEEIRAQNDDIFAETSDPGQVDRQDVIIRDMTKFIFNLLEK